MSMLTFYFEIARENEVFWLFQNVLVDTGNSFDYEAQQTVYNHRSQKH
jgi:hypothetical protein